MKLLLALTAVLIAAVPAANATRRETRIQFAKRAAIQYWGQPPCAGQYRVMLADLPPDRYGQATYTVRPDGSVTGCVIELARGQFAAGLHAPRDWLCSIVVHEVGHLEQFYEAGGPDSGTHSADPANVMFPTATDRNIAAPCRTGRPLADRIPRPPGRQ